MEWCAGVRPTARIKPSSSTFTGFSLTLKSRVLAAEQRLFRVLLWQGSCRVGPAVLLQFRFGAATANDTNITQVSSRIAFYRIDFRCIVGSHRSLPVQPELPAAGHGVGRIDHHDSRPFPVPAAPRCRMQSPEILGPQFAK